jgi:hypothetical protein
MKKKTLSQWVSWRQLSAFLFLSFFVLSGISSANMMETTAEEHIVSPFDFEQTYSYTFTVDDFNFTKVNGYDVVMLKDGDILNEKGKPMLPMKSILIAIPNDIKITDCTLSDVQTRVLEEDYILYLSQEPLAYHQMTKSSSQIKHLSRETPSHRYPDVAIVLGSQMDYAGQSMVEVLLFPVTYSSEEYSLIMRTLISFTLYGNKGYEYGDYLPRLTSDAQKTEYEKRIKELVINPEEVTIQTTPHDTPTPLNLPDGGPYDHVIITPE